MGQCLAMGQEYEVLNQTLHYYLDRNRSQPQSLKLFKAYLQDFLSKVDVSIQGGGGGGDIFNMTLPPEQKDRVVCVQCKELIPNSESRYLHITTCNHTVHLKCYQREVISEAKRGSEYACPVCRVLVDYDDQWRVLGEDAMTKLASIRQQYRESPGGLAQAQPNEMSSPPSVQL